MYKIMRRQPRHFEECDDTLLYYNGYRIHLRKWCVVTYVAVCLCLTALIILSVIFMQVFEFCETDADCPDEHCSRGVCNTICRLEPIADCCIFHDDCPALPCQETFCTNNQCRTVPLTGDTCDDGSECTINDKCLSGVCVGDPVTRRCHVCNQNIFVKAADGTACDDADVCTESDTCQDGICTGSEKQCSATPCNVGVCQQDVGCVLQPTNEIENNDLCSTSTCSDGVLTVTPKNCFDGNPCTVDACYSLTGECVNPPADAGGCMTTCTENEDCHAIGSNANYACWDGNCADITAGEMIIRVSHAEIDFDGCPNNHARLQIRFFMDNTVENNIFHIPLTESIQYISPYMQAFDVMSEHRGTGIRTYFSMRSTCRDLTIDCYPFINGEYEFVVNRYPCHTLTGANCIMEPTPTYVMLPLSLVNCPFDQHRVIQRLPDLTLEQYNTQHMWVVNATIVAEYQSPWMTDIMFCIPKELPLAACITNQDIEHCPYRGCRDTPSMYLDETIHFLVDSNYPGAVTSFSSQYSVEFAHGYEAYDGDKCASNHSVDWFSFNVMPLRDSYEGRQGVLDIQYVIPSCGRRRLMESTHTVGVFQL